MDPESVERRLAAILSADVVGYSRLMAEDEAATVRTLSDYREEIGLLVRQHRGRVVDTAGDSLLAEFPTATDAVSCAVDIQGSLEVRNAALAPERRMEFRIGIDLGEVRAEADRLYGDGVNVAARLGALAEPGGISISGTVRDQVEGKLDLACEDLGEQALKNIPKPVRVYRVLPGTVHAEPPPSAGMRGRRLRTAGLVAAGVVLLVGAGIALSWPRPLGLLMELAGLLGPPVNPPLPDEPSIVVLPFANMSDDPGQEYFSDGITEDLTTDLSGVPGLLVIARNSAFTYKERTVPVETVGRELGVRYVLEGSVRRAGERVRITAQLIDASTAFHLWSRRYDRDLADIFALQSEISEEILGALQVEIREAELQRIRRKPTRDLSAYDAYLRGEFHFWRTTREDNAQARRLAEQAIELDPSYAHAQALLGGTYNAEYTLGWNLDPTLLDRAEELGRRAIELDPSHARGHMILAVANISRARYEEAIAAAERAIELAPNWDAPHFILAGALARQGRVLPTAQAMNRAMRLNPRPPGMYLVVIGWVSLRAGREREAVQMWERVRAANPDLILARLALANHYQERGRHEEARAAVEEILRVNPDLTAKQAAALAFPRIDPEYHAEVEERLRSAGLPEVARPADDPFTVPGFAGAPAIAVLPFDNLSSDPDQEYFADGLAEELITRLSTWGSLPVIARNSSFRYRGASADVKQVSRELGVRYVVEGSVRRADDRLRISAQLIDATTGRHVWAETYDRELRGIFRLQDEITEAIVGAIDPALLKSEMARAAHKEPESLDAYDQGMRGFWHLLKRTKKDNAKARTLFESAIEMNPEWAGPFSGLAITHYHDVLYQWSESPDRSIEEALRAAQRCATLNHTLDLCHVALSWAYSLTGQREEAIAAAEAAVQLNPSGATGHFPLGLFLGVTGRPDDGIAHLEKAIRLSPQDPMMGFFLHCVGLAHFAAGRYEQAVEWEQQSLGRHADYYIAHGTLAASHAHLGQMDAASRAVQEMLRCNPEFSPDTFRTVFSFADPTFIENWLDGVRKAGLEEWGHRNPEGVEH